MTSNEEIRPAPSSEDFAFKRLKERYEAKLAVLNQPDARDRIERVLAAAGKLKTPIKVPDTY